MDDITLFHYKKNNSLFHRFNAVLKIIMLLVLSTMIIAYETNGLFYLSVFTTALLAASGIKFTEIFIQGRIFLFFLIFIMLAYSFSSEGAIIYKFYFIKISRDGIINGLFQCWKFSLFIITSIFFTSTTDPASFKKAVFFLLKPVPFLNHRRIASISGISLSMLPKILDNYKITNDALSSRCFNDNRNIYRKMKILSSSIIMSNILNIKNTADSYISRNYDEMEINYQIEISKKDVLYFLITLLFLLPSVFINFPSK